jgi:hypothetical protein
LIYMSQARQMTDLAKLLYSAKSLLRVYFGISLD